MPLAKLDPQGYGSAITYARRYALASVLGIVAGEDDDANAATVTTTHQAPYDNKVQSTPTKKAAAPPVAIDRPSAPNGNVADPRAWLQEKVQNDTVNFGFVADAAVMTEYYNDREHVRNALTGYEIAPGMILDNPDFRIKVTAAGGLKVFDWLMSRKQEAQDA